MRSRAMAGRLGAGTAVVALMSTLLVIDAAPALAADNGIRVEGRIVYEDGEGDPQPVRGALVKVCDEDFFGVFYCHELATVRSSTDGTFAVNVTDNGEDGASEIYVEVTAESSGVRVTPALVDGLGTPFVTYCFRSGKRTGNDGDTEDFSDLAPLDNNSCDVLSSPLSSAKENGAFFAFDQVHRAYLRMRDINDDLGLEAPSMVDVALSDTTTGVSFFSADPPTILLKPSAWTPETGADPTIFHEYGHHLLKQFAESPAPDYTNGNCDDENEFLFITLPDPGHCLWTSELGLIAWTEGFPDFLAAALDHEVYPSSSNPVWPRIGSFSEGGADYWYEYAETPPLEANDEPEGAVGRLVDDRYLHEAHGDTDYTHVEGFTAAALWDLYDPYVDDHDRDGRLDRADVSLGQIWEVVTSFDPAFFDDDHDHPTTLEEFREGLFQLDDDLIEIDLTSAFVENHFGGDLPSLFFGDVSDVDVTWNELTTYHRGDSFLVDDARVCNATGAANYDRDAFLTLTFDQPGVAPVMRFDVNIGQIGPDGSAFCGANTDVSFTIPDDLAVVGPQGGSNLALTLDAHLCIDKDRMIPEVDETDNCMLLPDLRIQNEPPVPVVTVESLVDVPYPTNTDGAYLVDEGSSVVLDASGSYDPDPRVGGGLDISWTSDLLSHGSTAADVVTLNPVDSPELADESAEPLLLTLRLEETPADAFSSWIDVPVELLVQNVTPYVVLDDGSTASPLVITEGGTAVLTGAFADPGADSWTGTVEFLDFAETIPLVIDPATKTFTVSRAFPDDTTGLSKDQTDFRLCIDDGDGGEGCIEGIVKVLNSTPIVTAPTGVEVDEGSAESVGVPFTDPGADRWTGTAVFGSSGPLSMSVDQLLKRVDVVGPWTDDGSVVGQVCVADDESATGCDDLTVTVNNVAPTAAIASVPNGVPVRAVDSVVATFTDPGALDTHTATIDWGDGSSSTAAMIEPVGGTPGRVTAPHAYTDAGSFTVEVCVLDDDGDSHCVRAPVTVLSAEEALAASIASLQALSSQPKVAQALVLLSSTNPSNAGALQRLAGGEDEAALRKIAKALTELANTTGTSTAQRTLAQVAESVAAEHLATLEALANTSPGARKKLVKVRALVASGRTAVGQGRLVDAVVLFADSVKVANG
ncbi:MAG: PKD domain-containing protein [Acidimicrobiales bacterium]